MQLEVKGIVTPNSMFHRVRFYVCLNFASSGLLTYFWHFCDFSPVQSSD